MQRFHRSISKRFCEESLLQKTNNQKTQNTNRSRLGWPWKQCDTSTAYSESLRVDGLRTPSHVSQNAMYPRKFLRLSPKLLNIRLIRMRSCGKSPLPAVMDIMVAIHLPLA